ncbi:MAG: AsmA-like C-terminal region-containing protein, partial [Defluviitaleaceae bacterium]|nr:AsmA-like C-terminal region-containing protein [Defluviitaleaceae bacterium]
LEEHLDRRTLSLTLTAAKIQASQLRPLSSAFPKLDAPLDGHVSLDCAAKGNAPLWQGMRGVLDLQLGRGVWDAAPEGEGAASWPLNSAQANLRFSAKPAPPQSGEQPREAALVEVSGSARVDSPGMARQTQVELKGQAGLDASGKPLWYRQPKLDVVQTMDLPFNAPGKMTRVAWSGRFEADTEKGGMSLLDVEGNVGGDIPFRCAFALQPTLGARSGAKSPLAVAGHLDIPLFNVRNAAARLGYALPAEASPEAWRRARFSAQLRGTLKDLQLYSIQAALDDSAITGQIRLGGPRTKVDLSVDSLDLDKLAPESRIKPPSKRPEEPLPLAQLRSLALDSSVHIGRLTRSRLTWENLAGEFTAEGGRFRLNLQAPSFYDGPYRLDVSGDARGAELKATANLRMDRFSVPRILKDLTGGTAFPAGLADFQVDVDTRGTTDRQLRRNATGTAHIRVSDGKLGLKDTPPRPAPQPTEASDTGWNARIRQTSATPASDGSLAFSRLAASFAIRGGLAVTKDLALASNTVNARGDGWISLDDETIDLNITAGIPNVGGVPVRINGPLYDPKLNIDKAKMFEGSLVEMFKGVIRLPANILDQLRR